MPNVQIGSAVISVEHLRGKRYVARPPGALGTCGFYPYPWDAIFVTAVNEIDAARKAYPKVIAQYKKSRE